MDGTFDAHLLRSVERTCTSPQGVSEKMLLTLGSSARMLAEYLSHTTIYLFKQTNSRSDVNFSWTCCTALHSADYCCTIPTIPVHVLPLKESQEARRSILRSGLLAGTGDEYAKNGEEEEEEIDDALSISYLSHPRKVRRPLFSCLHQVVVLAALPPPMSLSLSLFYRPRSRCGDDIARQFLPPHSPTFFFLLLLLSRSSFRRNLASSERERD